MRICISHYITVLCITGAVIACGKTRKPHEERLEYRSQYVTARMQVGAAYDVPAILNDAIMYRRLYDFQGTKWFLYDGRYLFTSKVYGPRVYRLEK